MPCRDWSDAEKYETKEDLRTDVNSLMESNRILNKSLIELQERNDKLARMLCKLCGQVENHIDECVMPDELDMDSELYEWYEEHKLKDIENQNKQALKTLDKLTPEEAENLKTYWQRLNNNK